MSGTGYLLIAVPTAIGLGLLSLLGWWLRKRTKQ